MVIVSHTLSLKLSSPNVWVISVWLLLLLETQQMGMRHGTEL